MRIAILSSHEEVLGFIDNDASESLHYFNDELHIYLKGNASTFTFSVMQQQDASKYLVVGNHLVFNWNDRDYYMTIEETEQDEDTLKVISYSGSLELVNEEVSKYSGSKMSFEQYFNVFNTEGTLSLGINEVSDKTLTFEWTGTATLLSRLFSLATEFDAEIEFIPVLNNYSLDHIQVNAYREHDDTYQGVGRSHDEIIRYGKEVDSIKKTSSISDMYTAIYPKGKDDLTIESLDGREVLDDNGNVLYFVDKKIIRAKQAQEQFPSTVTGWSQYIVKNYSYDTDNVEMLYGQALSNLKKNCVPTVEYDMDGYVEANIGDTFRVEDTEFNPPLYLETRVTEMQICTTKLSNSKMKFDNYTELNSDVSQLLLDKVSKLVENNKKYAVIITTDNGVVLKNSDSQTTLTVIVQDGQNIVTDQCNIEWSEVVNGETIHLSNEKSVIFDAYSFENKINVRVVVSKDGYVRGMNELTLTNLSDVYKQSENAIIKVAIEYAKSNSNSDPPIEGWEINPPDVGDDEYLWQRTTTTKADGSTESTEALCITGIKGADATIIYIDSTDGNVFKNNAVATKLKVTVQIGNISITGIERLKAVYGHSAFLQWSYKGLKGEKVILSQDDPKISDDGFTLSIEPKDIDVKGTFTCDLIIEELTKNGN
jgi:phage minor structural protein|nr:MAG TPA: tail protein [Caudoviricetes sp.]